MDLPKNITQVGETNRNCKIYVEDYVVSYIKQLNGHAVDKELAVALFGTRKDENEISYYFVYGASKLVFLQKETRHLSQAVLQEAEKIRKKYFEEYDFLGYRFLNGDMIEGFHIYEQGVGRYVSGYAQFYEKNDSMLQFMLAERAEAKPEVISQEKYETVKLRQEERRTLAAEGQRRHTGKSFSKYRQMKYSAAAVFLLVCIIGVMTLNGTEKIEQLQVIARQMLSDFSVRKLPDSKGLSADSTMTDTIVAQDKLAEAIREENSYLEASGTDVINEIVSDYSIDMNEDAETVDVFADETSAETIGTDDVMQNGTSSAETIGTVNVGEQLSETTGNNQVETVGTDSVEMIANEGENQEMKTMMQRYVVCRGDTLSEICIRQYGNEQRLAEICELNHIIDPDDIKFGEEILLPQ